jgi:regulator of replication initiation timing
MGDTIEDKFDLQAFHQELDDLTNDGEEDFDRLMDSARERISISSTLQTPPPISRRHRSATSPREEPPAPVETPDIRLFTPNPGQQRRTQHQPELDSVLSQDDDDNEEKGDHQIGDGPHSLDDNNDADALKAIIQRQVQHIRALELENEKLRQQLLGTTAAYARSPGERFAAELYAEHSLPERHYDTLSRVMDQYFQEHPRETTQRRRRHYGY